MHVGRLCFLIPVGAPRIPPPMTGFLSPTIVSIDSCMNPYKHSPFKSPRNDGKDVYSIRIFFSLLLYNLICINWFVGLSSPSGSASPIPASRLLFRGFTLARQKANFPSETKKKKLSWLNIFPQIVFTVWPTKWKVKTKYGRTPLNRNSVGLNGRKQLSKRPSLDLV